MTTENEIDDIINGNSRPPQIPLEWGCGQPNKKKPGRRWEEPNNEGNGVRVDKGDPKSKWPSQREPHVVVRKTGRILGSDGQPIGLPKPSKTPEAHIPLQDWLKWKTWHSP